MRQYSHRCPARSATCCTTSDQGLTAPAPAGVTPGPSATTLSRSAPPAPPARTGSASLSAPSVFRSLRNCNRASACGGNRRSATASIISTGASTTLITGPSRPPYHTASGYHPARLSVNRLARLPPVAHQHDLLAGVQVRVPRHLARRYVHLAFHLLPHPR